LLFAVSCNVVAYETTAAADGIDDFPKPVTDFANNNGNSSQKRLLPQFGQC
jgi:hypothetical protein